MATIPMRHFPNSLLALGVLGWSACAHPAPAPAGAEVAQVPASELGARLGAVFGPAPVTVTIYEHRRVEVSVADTTLRAGTPEATARADSVARWTWLHYAERAGVKSVLVAFVPATTPPPTAAREGLLFRYSAAQLRALAGAAGAP